MHPSILVNKLAELEHDQWVGWSKSIASEVSAERRASWEKLWVPFSSLAMAEQDVNRVRAIKSMPVILEFTSAALNDSVDMMATVIKNVGGVEDGTK